MDGVGGVGKSTNNFQPPTLSATGNLNNSIPADLVYAEPVPILQPTLTPIQAQKLTQKNRDLVLVKLNDLEAAGLKNDLEAAGLEGSLLNDFKEDISKSEEIFNRFSAEIKKEIIDVIEIIETSYHTLEENVEKILKDVKDVMEQTKKLAPPGISVQEVDPEFYTRAKQIIQRDFSKKIQKSFVVRNEFKIDASLKCIHDFYILYGSPDDGEKIQKQFSLDERNMLAQCRLLEEGQAVGPVSLESTIKRLAEKGEIGQKFSYDRLEVGLISGS